MKEADKWHPLKGNDQPYFKDQYPCFLEPDSVWDYFRGFAQIAVILVPLVVVGSIIAYFL